MALKSWARHKSGVRLQVAFVLFVSVVLLSLLTSIATVVRPSFLDGSFSQVSYSGRHLLSEEETLNCTPPAIEQFPRPWFTPEQRRNGAIVVDVLIACYMFLALAIVCDSYFVPSLEIICDILKIPADVGGATFMAAGSSAPELATAVIAVFVAKDDIGVGTVVGSAVYNVTFVISICALFAGMVVYLHWWPLMRDCVIYTLSIVALILIILDGFVTWWEALLLVLFYICYILLMFINRRLERWMINHATCCPSHLERTKTYHKIATESDESPNKEISNGSVKYDGSCSKGVIFTEPDEITEETALLPTNKEEQKTVLSFPDGKCQRFIWVISLPITIVLFFTTPDCRLDRWRKWFVVTFVISLVWLSVYSYVIVWMITIIGYTLGIPDTIMGLTFVAFGVSVPDAIASLIVIREGEGDMAVSNAVGSNIFDILICLGIPWLLSTAAVNPGQRVPVRSQGLVYSSITLLSTVVILLGVTHLNKWKMNIKYGVILMIMYVIVTALSALYELDFFGISHIPECPSDY